MQPVVTKAFAIFIIAASLTTALARPAWCWDKFAHEIVAQIAYDRLTPSARRQSDVLVSQLAYDPYVAVLPGQFKPYNFVTAAAWMDDMKPTRGQPEGTRQFSSWHFIDLPLDPKLTRADVMKYRDANTSNCYLTITNYCMPALRNPRSPIAVRARAFGFLLHLVGDIHQPLHCAGPDRGGNTFKIARLPSDDPSYSIKNLHAFWDGAYRYSARSGDITLALSQLDTPRIAAPGVEPVSSIARDMAHQYGSQVASRARDLDPADWALESNRVATQFAFPQAAYDLSAAYVQRSHDVACRQLVLAGFRLASVLNGLFRQTDGGVTSPRRAHNYVHVNRITR